MRIGLGFGACLALTDENVPFCVYDVAYLITHTKLKSDQDFEARLPLFSRWPKQARDIARQFWVAGQIRQPKLEGLPPPGGYMYQTWVLCPAREVDSFYRRRLWVPPEADDFSYATWRLTHKGWQRPAGLIETKRSVLSPIPSING